jgi:hypothetical protein
MTEKSPIGHISNNIFYFVAAHGTRIRLYPESLYKPKGAKLALRHG